MKYEDIYQDEDWLDARPCVQNMDREFRNAIKYTNYVSQILTNTEKQDGDE